MTILRRTAKKIAGICGYDLQTQVSAGNDIDSYLELYGDEAVSGRRFYNIGAGGFRHPAWTNVDHQSNWYEDMLGDAVSIDWDLFSLNPLPVERDVARIVYTSHTIEHINDSAAQNLFEESYRILRRNGIFRLTMPDVDLNYHAYRTNDRSFYFWKEMYVEPEEYHKVCLNRPMTDASIQQLFLWEVATSLSTMLDVDMPRKLGDSEIDSLFNEMERDKALDYLISLCSVRTQQEYPGFHMNWWSEAKLTRMLKSAGFKTVYRSGYGQSVTPVMRNKVLFDNTKPEISLYMEAIK